MDDDLATLTSIASGGLGRWVDGPDGSKFYEKDVDCLVCLRHLQRILREDDPESRPALLASWRCNLAKTDLVPLLVAHADDAELTLAALKALTLLALPPPPGLVEQSPALLSRARASVRDALLARDALAVALGSLARPLAARLDARAASTVQLVAALVHGLLAVPPPAHDASSAVCEALADRASRWALARALLEEGGGDLFSAVAGLAGELELRPLAPLLVHLILALLSLASPQLLLEARVAAGEGEKGTGEETQKNGAKMTLGTSNLGPPSKLRTAQHPSLQRQHAHAPSRHPHTSAVFVRRHVEHAGGVVFRNAPNMQQLPAMPGVVNAKQALAQRRQGPGTSQGPRLRDLSGPERETVVGLAAWLDEFLESGAYNALMHATFAHLRPGLLVSTCPEQDFLAFLKLAAHCMGYVRLREEARLAQPTRASTAPCAPPASPAPSPFAGISSTAGFDTFHWLHTLWVGVADVAEGGARQTHREDKRWEVQHAAAPLLKELLLLLDLARVVGSSADAAAARRLERRLYYDDDRQSGLLPVLARLVRGYNYRFQPRAHALELVGLLHVVLRTLDRLERAEGGGRLVRRSARRSPGGRGRRRKESEGAEQGEGAGEKDATEGDGEKDATEGAGEKDASESDGEKDATEGAGERDATEGKEAHGVEEQVEQSAQHSEDDGDDGDQEEDRSQARTTRQATFEASRRIRAECASPSFVHFYAWLLSGYASNDAQTNHVLVDFLDRVASPKRLNLEPMLFQLSVLRVFHAILADARARKDPRCKAMVGLAARTVRSLLARLVPDLSEMQAAAEASEAGPGAGEGSAETGSPRESPDADSAAARDIAPKLELEMRSNAAAMLFAELLFWKAPGTAEDIAAEYNWRKLAVVHDPKAISKVPEELPPLPSAPWTDEERIERLRGTFEKCNGLADCLARLADEFDGDYSRVTLSKQLRHLGLQRGKFTPRQDDRLREMFAEHGPDRGTSEIIAERLDCGFTAQRVSRRLRELGLAAGKKGKVQQGAQREEDEWLAVLASSASEGEAPAGRDYGGLGSDEDSVESSSEDEEEGTGEGAGAGSRGDRPEARRKAALPVPASPDASPPPQAAPGTTFARKGKAQRLGEEARREAPANEQAADRGEERAAALDLLRRKRLTKLVSKEAEPLAKLPLSPSAKRPLEDLSAGDAEETGTAPRASKPKHRRLVRRAAGPLAAVALSASLEDLEDDA